MATSVTPCLQKEIRIFVIPHGCLALKIAQTFLETVDYGFYKFVLLNYFTVRIAALR